MRDLARIAMTRTVPITQFEPLSMIQVLCEEVRYNVLLTQAAQARDAVDRMALVAAFAVAGYSSTNGRSRKPFNPILGETFDYVEPTWRFHGEQVSHHPPIVAGFAEGPGWVWWHTNNAETNTSKLTQTIEVTTTLPVRIKLATCDGQEEYAGEKVKSIIEKAMDHPEKRRIVHVGKLCLRSANGLTCDLYFKNDRSIVGEIYKGQVVQCRLLGKWDAAFYKVSSTGQQSLLFQAAQPSDEARQYYGFSPFSMTLNEVPAGESLPPTDSRLRPDQRALEEGFQRR